ncbi:hypothetical protein TI05_04965 [Achromatium sp. WMS3]|nr:hypothetical protein TI05_04965 [Achromatium sp. WMS3]
MLTKEWQLIMKQCTIHQSYFYQISYLLLLLILYSQYTFSACYMLYDKDGELLWQSPTSLFDISYSGDSYSTVFDAIRAKQMHFMIMRNSTCSTWTKKTRFKSMEECRAWLVSMYIDPENPNVECSIIPTNSATQEKKCDICN